MQRVEKIFSCDGAHRAKAIFFGASWTFVGKVKAEHGLHFEWSKEKPEPASVVGGTTQPAGVAYVPVGLAGCNGVFRFTVVEQDVPPLLPVGVTGTLQASLDLDDKGDKVVFRQFGGKSSQRTFAVN